MKSFYRKVSQFLIVSIILLTAIHVQNAKSVYYEVAWSNTKTPSGIAISAQFSLIASNIESKLFVATEGGRLYLSSNGGDNWTETQPAGDVDKNWSSISISGDGQKLFASVSGGRLYSSLNGGSSWTEIQPAGNIDKNWSSVFISSSGDIVLASVNPGRLYYSLDAGSNWFETQPAGNVDKNWSTLYTAGLSLMVVGVENGRLYRSGDLEDAWYDFQPVGDVDKNWSSFNCNTAASVCLAAVDGGRLYRSTSGTSQWAEVQPAGDIDYSWSSVVVGGDGRYLFAGSSTGRLYYSGNTGSNWYETQPDGDLNKDWSALAIKSNGTTVWAADKTNVVFNGVISAPAPVMASNFSTVSNTTTVNAFSSYPTYDLSVTQNSGTSIFSYPHGTVSVGNKIYIGTRTSPPKIVVFNDPDDLSNNSSTTIPGLASIENMTYDSVNNRIYATVATTLLSTESLKIYSINPNNINDYVQVVDEASLPNFVSSAIVNDGEYIYGVTYSSTPKFFKYRISDWSLVLTNSWLGGPEMGHAGKIQVYSDRTEIYFTAALGDSAVAKVNASDLSYEDYYFGTDLAITDDLAFRYMDDTGGILYVGSEFVNLSYALDTRTMTSISFVAPKTYGNFIDDNNLYILGIDGYIAEFVDYDLDSPVVYKTSGEVPNEFFSINGKIYFTNWSSPSYLKEFEGTSNLSTSSTVILSWDGDTPSIQSRVYISTDNVSYTELSNGSSPYTFNNLTPDTQYWFKVTPRNNSVIASPAYYTVTTPSFTAAPLASIPRASYSATKKSITLNWQGSNASEYLVKNISSNSGWTTAPNNSGWTTATSYTFSNLNCNTDYLIKLKAKNSDGVETAYHVMNLKTQVCSDGFILPNVAPTAIEKNLDFIINNGKAETDNPDLSITMNANPISVKGYSISLNEDFSQSSIIPYESSETNFMLPDKSGLYTVYLKYYSITGDSSSTIKKTILYTSLKEETVKPLESKTIPSLEPDNPQEEISPQKTKDDYELFQRNLMYGMWGDDVYQLQKFLNKNSFILASSGAGSPSNETRFFGPLTRSAVSAFQSVNNIVPTWGIFGPITRSIINKMIQAE